MSRPMALEPLLPDHALARATDPITSQEAAEGVNVTEKLEVLTGADEILPGLYATGNNLSGISVAAYQNVEGVGLSTALTTGRLAGQFAAEYAAE